MKRRTLAGLLSATGLRPLLASCLPPRGILGLNYHRIGDGSRSNLDRSLWSASEEAFDRQLRYLKRNSEVIGPDDIDAARKDRRSLHVLITFDDGYLDNYELAYAALRRHDLPATFFIATGFIDRPRLPWWDEIASLVRALHRGTLDLADWLPAPLAVDDDTREAAIQTLLATYKSLPAAQAAEFLARLRTVTGGRARGGRDDLWMTWDMVREMAAGGMTIGGHTINHAILSGLDEDEQWQEISGCAARLERETGRPMRYFAYPVGGRSTFDAASRRCLERLGVRYAFSYYGGYTGAGAEIDRYDIPRMPIEPYIDGDWFRAIVQLPRIFCRRTQA